MTPTTIPASSGAGMGATIPANGRFAETPVSPGHSRFKVDRCAPTIVHPTIYRRPASRRPRPVLFRSAGCQLALLILSILSFAFIEP